MFGDNTSFRTYQYLDHVTVFIEIMHQTFNSTLHWHKEQARELATHLSIVTCINGNVKSANNGLVQCTCFARYCFLSPEACIV